MCVPGCVCVGVSELPTFCHITHRRCQEMAKQYTCTLQVLAKQYNKAPLRASLLALLLLPLLCSLTDWVLLRRWPACVLTPEAGGRGVCGAATLPCVILIGPLTLLPSSLCG